MNREVRVIEAEVVSEDAASSSLIETAADLGDAVSRPLRRIAPDVAREMRRGARELRAMSAEMAAARDRFVAFVEAAKRMARHIDQSRSPVFRGRRF